MARRQSQYILNSIPERALAFGATKDVIEDQEKPVVRALNEESIYKTNGNILELKNYRSESDSNEDEDRVTTTTTTKKPKRKEFVPSRLTYDNLGYEEAAWNNPNYEVITNMKVENNRRPSVYRHRRVQTCNTCNRPNSRCGCKDQAGAQSQISAQELSFESSDSQSSAWST